VEPACAVLEIAPSTYYAAKKREENPPARDARDETLKEEILRVWKEKGRGVYGARKVWRELTREGIEVARCTVERLMRELGIAGAAARRKRPRTTVPAGPGHERPSDLLERDFTAPAPNRLWVVDFTYVATWSGFAFTAFVSDVFSRRIVGWRTAGNMLTALPLDALEMALWTRGREGRVGHGGRLDGLIHHSDAGRQYVSIRYSNRLADAGALASIGSVGDSYDNAQAESLIGLYKAECVRRDGPWRGVDDLELATLSWVHWFNTTRLHSSLGHVPPVELEENYYRQNDSRQHPLPGELTRH
jgi:putative transposase